MTAEFDKTRRSARANRPATVLAVDHHLDSRMGQKLQSKFYLALNLSDGGILYLNQFVDDLVELPLAQPGDQVLFATTPGLSLDAPHLTAFAIAWRNPRRFVAASAASRSEPALIKETGKVIRRTPVLHAPMESIHGTVIHLAVELTSEDGEVHTVTFMEPVYTRYLGRKFAGFPLVQVGSTVTLEYQPKLDAEGLVPDASVLVKNCTIDWSKPSGAEGQLEGDEHNRRPRVALASILQLPLASDVEKMW